MLKEIGRRLKDLHGFNDEIHLKKPSPSHAVPEDAARDLAGRVHLVLAGIGD